MNYEKNLMRILSLLIAVFFTFTCVYGDVDYDVCILGSGAAGMSAAAFLKDKDYNVIVFEKQSEIGGYCQTRFFDLPPFIPPGSPNWIELGVIIFENSTTANANGNGNWALDTVAFANRFATGYANGFAIPIDLTGFGQMYNVSLTLGINYGPRNNTPTPEFQEAFFRLYTYLQQYPWINNAEWPDPIPSELLVPFSQFIEDNNFQILGPSFFRNSIFSGGVFDYDNTPAIYALGSVTPAILGFTFIPNSMFTMFNGCSQIYQGINNYIGGVVTDAQIIRVKRKNNNIKLDVIVDGVLKKYKCGKLIVAYPQLLEDIYYLDLDRCEINVFKNARNFYYYSSEISVNGPLSVGQSFTIFNVNQNNTYGYPDLPADILVGRNLPYGPGYSFGGSINPISQDSMYAIMQGQLNNMPPDLLTNITITERAPHDKFLAHFTKESLLQSPNIYTRLKNLQGHRNTYWLGTLRNYADSAILWDQSYKFVQEYF